MSATVAGLSYDNQGLFNDWSQIVKSSQRYSHELRDGRIFQCVPSCQRSHISRWHLFQFYQECNLYPAVEEATSQYLKMAMLPIPPKQLQLMGLMVQQQHEDAAALIVASEKKEKTETLLGQALDW